MSEQAPQEAVAQPEAKPTLKALRTRRKDSVAEARAKVKTQNKEVGLIKKALAEGPATVPALAQATGLDSPKVLYYIASMMKYGQVVEEELEGDYFRYGLKPKDDEPEE